MTVPMLDLKAQFRTIKSEVESAVTEVFENQQFRGGPVVDAFEAAMARFTASKYAMGVASGTDALYLTFRAMDLKPGDEVITTPFSFFATGGAIVNAGGRPVFVDIDPDTFTLDVNKLEDAVNYQTRGIVPVHLFGQCADMDPILELAGRHGLTVVEDTAQALGAQYMGRPAGSMGQAGAISFYPTKNLGAAGEAGMIVTSDDALATHIKLLRSHGAARTYYHDIVGTNSHLHALQAAVLNVKLKYLDEWNERRAVAAGYYTECLAELDEVKTPVEAPGNTHVYHQYVIRLPRRDEAQKLFQERGIGCGVFYPLPLHQQPCFAHLGCAEMTCPEAEKASAEVLALPIFPEITSEQQDEVVRAIKDHLAAN